LTTLDVPLFSCVFASCISSSHVITSCVWGNAMNKREKKVSKSFIQLNNSLDADPLIGRCIPHVRQNAAPLGEVAKVLDARPLNRVARVPSGDVSKLDMCHHF